MWRCGAVLLGRPISWYQAQPLSLLVNAQADALVSDMGCVGGGTWGACPVRFGDTCDGQCRISAPATNLINCKGNCKGEFDVDFL